MTKESLANLLKGRQNGFEISDEEEKIAKENNLVVVFGYSDDNVEIRGALYDEVAAYGGCAIFISPITKELIEDKEDVFELKKHNISPIKVECEWQPEDDQGNVYACWLIKSGIPHATFDIMEHDELFCRGIVFSMDELSDEIGKVRFTEDDANFMRECDLYPLSDGGVQIITENDEGARLDKDVLLRLAETIIRYVNA